MTLSSDERRALGFVALLLFLSAGARIAARAPADLATTAAAADLDSLTAASRAERERAAARSRPLAAGERLDPNRASATELDRLPGIGPAVAGRIVAAREAGAVFTRAEDLAAVKGIGPATVKRVAPHLDFSRVVAVGSGGRPGPGGAAARTGGGQSGPGGGPAPVDVNRAAPAELETLPGIGPALAGRMVAFRDSAGPFRSLQELARVPGIGPRTLERLAGRVSF
ncbi:MAG TPA: ComEA family DNA-binding protein [Longimicrobiales bacterium]|nr:ComEA family DNA-binding protein [Longimicrobiales bacterium]